jgi:hypothetical protein
MARPPKYPAGELLKREKSPESHAGEQHEDEAEATSIMSKQNPRRPDESVMIAVAVAVMTVIVFSVVLILWARGTQPTVSIDFNVGEIIGGALGGLGALIAGVAYALRNRRE